MDEPWYSIAYDHASGDRSVTVVNLCLSSGWNLLWRERLDRGKPRPWTAEGSSQNLRRAWAYGMQRLAMERRRARKASQESQE